jgi:hypothetical protein
MKMEQTQWSETSAIKHHTPGNNPKDYTQHSEHGKSLKSRICYINGVENSRDFWHAVLHRLRKQQSHTVTYSHIQYIQSHTVTYSHIQSHTIHTITYSHIQSYTITYSHIQSHTVTYSHIQSHTITYSHIQSHTVTYSHIQSHTVTYSHIHWVWIQAKPCDAERPLQWPYRTANLQTLHFKYSFNKYPYWIF